MAANKVDTYSTDEDVIVLETPETPSRQEFKTSFQQFVRRRRKQQQSNQNKKQKTLKLSDLEVPPCPKFEGYVQKIKLTDAPVTSKIAESEDKLTATYDVNCEISAAAFHRIKYILTKCIQIMYSEEAGYICGPELVCEMKGFLRQSWTVKPTMTRDGLPICERDCVYAVLQMIERYIASKSADLTSMFDKLKELCSIHFLKRRRAGVFRHIYYSHRKDKATEMEPKEVKHTGTQIKGDLLCKIKHVGDGKVKEFSDKTTQLDFLLGDYVKPKNVCQVMRFIPEKSNSQIRRQLATRRTRESNASHQSGHQPQPQPSGSTQEQQQIPPFRLRQPLRQRQPFRFRDTQAVPDNSSSDSGPLFPEDNSPITE